MPLVLTAQGLQTQTQAEIIEQLSVRIQDQFGVNTNVTTSSIMGQLINIVSEFQAFDQQVLLGVYRRFDPNSAIGVALDALASLTGSIRRGATNSVVNGLATFSAAGVLNNGDLIQNDDNNTQWQLINGPVVAGAAGDFPATFQAVNTGPILANAGTNWSIVTVVLNFTAFNNPSDDATIGQNQESDEDFRRRRQVELYSQNIGPLLAIQGVVSKVNTTNGRVTNVRVYHNTSVVTDPLTGIPGKAFNVVVRTDPALPDPQLAGPIEPLAQDIADAIFSATGAGGESFGTDYGVVEQIDVIDVEGEAQGPIEFDLIKTLDIFEDITITLFSNNQDGPVIPEEPQDMADLIRSQVATTLTESFVIIGRDARALDTQGIIQGLIVSGELSGIETAIVGVSDTQPAFPITDLTAEVTLRQEPDYDSGNIRIEIDGTQF